MYARLNVQSSRALRPSGRRASCRKASRAAALRVHAELRDTLQAPRARSVPKENGTPTVTVLSLWRQCHAVCFDVDCTVTKEDGLDLLADFLGRGDEVAALTNKVNDISFLMHACAIDLNVL